MVKPTARTALPGRMSDLAADALERVLLSVLRELAGRAEHRDPILALMDRYGVAGEGGTAR